MPAGHPKIIKHLNHLTWSVTKEHPRVCKQITIQISVQRCWSAEEYQITQELLGKEQTGRVIKYT